MPGQGTYVIPVSNGIFEHCEKIGVAIWVFLWMLDHTTKEAPGKDGQTEGLVYGGRPIPARDIGNDLKVSPRVVNLHLARLLQHGYIRRIGPADGAPTGYCVLKSKKWTNRLTDNREENHSATEKIPSDTEKNSSYPEKISSYPEKISSRTEKKSTGTEKNSSPIYRNDTLRHKTSTRTKCKAPSAFVLPDWIPREPWDGFMEMRRKLRRPPTDHAKDLLVEKLAGWAASGQDPGEILNESTQNSWLGLFEIKSGRSNGKRNFNRAQTNVDSAIAGGCAAIASFGFDCGPLDEIGLDDGRADGFGRTPVTLDGRGTRRLAGG